MDRGSAGIPDTDSGGVEMKRSTERLVAVPDTVVVGPVLKVLACGCVADSIGGLWAPCAEVAEVHALACELAGQGLLLDSERRRRRGFTGWNLPTLPEDQQHFDDLIDTLRNHVANQKRKETNRTKQRPIQGL